MINKIHRRCKCGCCEVVSLGKKYVYGHHRKNKKHSKKSKLKMSLSKMGNTCGIGHKLSEEHKKKLSLANIGNTNFLGKKHSEGTKLKMSLAQIKYDPNYKYCEIWKDRKYVNDIRKDYCENVDCKK